MESRAANLFSVSPSPLQILERLPAELRARRLVTLATTPAERPVIVGGASPLSGTASMGPPAEPLVGGARSVLPLGLEGVDALLPGGGLLRGGVVELMVRGGGALGTTLALGACRAVQRDGQGWCGFVDPSGTLHAPGVAGLGVELERLLVVRPPLEMLSRVVLRMAEARVFSLLVVDTAGVADLALDVHLGPWVRVVRRLALALQGTESTVLLLTSRSAPRPLALPVSQRLELERRSERELSLAVTKDPQGRVAPPRPLAVQQLRGVRRTGPGLSSSRPRRMAGAA